MLQRKISKTSINIMSYCEVLTSFAYFWFYNHGLNKSILPYILRIVMLKFWFCWFIGRKLFKHLLLYFYYFLVSSYEKEVDGRQLQHWKNEIQITLAFAQVSKKAGCIDTFESCNKQVYPLYEQIQWNRRKYHIRNHYCL